VSDVTLLQAMRLKGRLSAEAAAACVEAAPDDVARRLEALVADGHAKVAGTAFRITPEGKERLAALLAEEQATVDQTALAEAYHEFDEHNTQLKMRDEKTPNEHDDPAYDADVIERLAALHTGFDPLVGRIVGLAPRLAPYRTRFRTALEKVQAGDHTFIARPITDSYHTVWFEFHEELIGLLGRTRAEEAAAGRAV
jgi:hypothetical protein